MDDFTIASMNETKEKIQVSNDEIKGSSHLVEILALVCQGRTRQ